MKTISVKNYSVYKLIEQSGSAGITTDEITKESGLPYGRVKKILNKLRQKGMVFRNISSNKWMNIKYQTDNEKDYNERMKWCAG